jgi:hypothetical protein
MKRKSSSFAVNTFWQNKSNDEEAKDDPTNAILDMV